jgi:hypothetical protein
MISTEELIQPDLSTDHHISCLVRMSEKIIGIFEKKEEDE